MIWGYDHATKPEITLWYHVSIYQWIDEVPKGLIGLLYETMAFGNYCGPPWAVKGGMETAMWAKDHRYIAQVKFYAT